jgi:predicted transcriptional regulator
MKALLSIKPKYVEQIIKGNKKYEFRKLIFKQKVDRIYIYSSAPTKKIIGHFTLSKTIEKSPKELWKELRAVSGISERDFFQYFMGKKKGFAIKIDCLELFDEPIDPQKHIKNFIPPQSFCYLGDDLLLSL